jgi:plastocyanin
VFSVASKTSFTAGVAALFVAAASVFVTHDRVGFSVLIATATAAAMLGVALFLYVPRDPLVPPSLDVEAAIARTVDLSDLPKPSVWPVVAAAGIVLLGVGAALGRSVVTMAMIVSVVAALGWFAQVWREHPSWTREMSERINDRFIMPIALPITIVTFAGIGVFSLSRVLLAVSKNAAPFIAGVLAFIVLGVFYFLSTRPRLGRGAVVALVLASSSLVVGSGIAGALKGERKFGEHAAAESNAIRVTAKDLKFSLTDLRLPASLPVKMLFENKDTAPHNLAIYDTKGGTELFRGQIVDGGKTATYDFVAPPPGMYYFQCDVHPALMYGQAESVKPESPVHVPGATSGSSPATPTSLPGH